LTLLFLWNAFLLLLSLICLAFITLALRLFVLKEDKDWFVSYLVAAVALLVYGLVTRQIHSLHDMSAFFLGTYFIGTAIWGCIWLFRKIVRLPQ
jgi:hypothetical protein